MLPGTSVLLLAAAAASFSPQALFDAWPERRVVTDAAPCLRHAELGRHVAELVARYPGRVVVERAGDSVEGREVQLLSLGSGPRRVMLWSQMHGDEPSATPALLDLVSTLLAIDAPEHRLILERLTLLVVPMLNPDGAERYARRNSQGIDVNRDALELASPEGRLLKRLRDRFAPELGFNLHDQNRRTTVGDTGVLATIALLAVSGDPQGTLTPGRARAKRVCAAVARTLAGFVPGGIARYDEDWNPRAFGDNLTAWGTPVVLIESGGLPPGLGYAHLTRLNYVALLTALHGLARDDLAGEDVSRYEDLARNADGGYVDELLQGGRILQPPGSEPYRADLGFDLLGDDRALAACPGAASGPGPSRIRELGDGRLLAAARRRDVAGRLLSPALVASVRGIEARAWLEAAALDAASRLGVARVRWHVAGPDREEAMRAAEALRAPGRAAVEVVGAEAPSHAIVLSGPPSQTTGVVSLAAALRALTRGGPGESGQQPLARQLAALVGAEAGAGPLLRPEGRASLLVLRPLRADAADATALALEAVLVDGREAGGGR